MLTRTTTAGMGDIYGPCYGHPNDPRTEDADEQMSAYWFVADELETHVRQLKAALRTKDGIQANRFLADIHDLVEPNH